MQVVFTPLAARQIESLHEYTSPRTQARSVRTITLIVAFRKGLTKFPVRRTRRDDLLLRLRVIGFERRATIAFAVTDSAILVEGTFYAGWDFETIFRAR